MNDRVAADYLERLAHQGAHPTGLSADSRAVKPGDLFLAYPGFSSDGRSFIPDAIERGAAAVLWEAEGGQWPEEHALPNLAVPALRDRVGGIADIVFGRPSSALWVVGVTGTNGKTTVSQWVARALTELGSRCGVIGTLGSGFPDQLKAGLHTTPDGVDMHRLLSEFVSEGAVAAAAEVSSIGLDQGRTKGVRFNVAIHTNLSRDHLDYHGSMERYAAAKASFFDVEGLEAAVINIDDAFGLTQARRLSKSGLRVIAYGWAPSNCAAAPKTECLLAEDLRTTVAGQQFVLCWQGERIAMHTRSVGRFNVSNMLAVVGALLARGVALDDAAAAVGRLSAPEGRMQLLGGVAEPLVIVDYAHTPDALAQVLDASRATATAREGRLICLFGCGGDRDHGKRAMMGEVAAARADRVVITSDNPRSEPAQAIIDDIAGGAPAAEQIVDRSEAVARVVSEAADNDVVLLAGKGHEPYQEIQGVRHAYSDLEQARAALAAWRIAAGDAS